MTAAARVVDLVGQAAAELAAAGVDAPRTDAEWLLAGLLDVGRFDAYVTRDRELDPALAVRYAAMVRRRAAGEPLQHVLGWEAFRGLRLRVTRDALIPRPETEGLVEWALEYLPPGPALVVDVGTGSGCIACALAIDRRDVRVLAVDCSWAAASVAAGNVSTLDLGRRVGVVVADLLEALAPACADLVVSNPPYLSVEALAAAPPEVREREPRLALLGGHDGLDVLRGVIVAAQRVLGPGGALVLETAGPGQVASLTPFLSSAGYAEVASRPDLGGTVRFVAARRAGGAAPEDAFARGGAG